jgi:GNAT superfamily N-acetyltransferase
MLRQLSHFSRCARRISAPLPGAGLSLLGARDEARYTAIHRALGERWMWFSRLALSAQERANIIGDPKVEAYAFVLNGADAGLLELDFRAGEEAELAFFGVYDDAIGTGAGRWLMDRALELTWKKSGLKRLFVHTCTLDHSRALEFYQKSGFTPYKTALEVTPDPRRTGLLPPGAAPHAPLIGSP